MAKPTKTPKDGAAGIGSTDSAIVNLSASAEPVAVSTTDPVGIDLPAGGIAGEHIFGQFASDQAQYPQTAADGEVGIVATRPAVVNPFASTEAAPTTNQAGNDKAKVPQEAGEGEASNTSAELGAVIEGQFIDGESAVTDQPNPYAGIIEDDDDGMPVVEGGQAAAPAKAENLASTEVVVIENDLAATFKGLSVLSSPKTREQARETIEAANVKSGLLEGGSVLIRQMTVAATTAYYLTAGNTDAQRQEAFVEEVSRLKLTASKSKSPAANVIIATLRLDIQDKDKKSAKDNRGRVDRDGLAVEATARAVLKKVRAGEFDLTNGEAILNASLAHLKAQGGVVAVSNAERKRKRDAEKAELDGTDSKDITPIPLDDDLYAASRTDMVKKALNSQTGGERDFTVGLGIIEDGKAVDFLPVQFDRSLKQRLLDSLVVPPANVQFISELVVLARTIVEFKTAELVNKNDDPKDPDAPRIIAHRVLIARSGDHYIVVGRRRDAGVVLLADPNEPLFKEPVEGDLIMARPGFQHLAANLTAADRRAAFTVKVDANRNDRDGKSPVVAVLATRVAQAKDKKGEDGKDNNYASCVASLICADKTATWSIKIIDEALVKPKVTATVKATVFQDAADRLPVLSGKKAGDRVTIQAKDDTLFLTNGDDRVVCGCAVSGADDSTTAVQVHRDDMSRVIKAIASQMLTGPVIIGIDPTGIVRFDFTTNVGRFSLLIPTMLKDDRNPRHFVPFIPSPWMPAAASPAA